MNESQAIDAALQIGVPLGDHILLQSNGQIIHPHFHSGQTSGLTHVDGWYVENRNGVLYARKIHSDDL